MHLLVHTTWTATSTTRTLQQLVRGLFRRPSHSPLFLSSASTVSRTTTNNTEPFLLRLNNLQDNPGAVKQKRRVGRGVGSSKGKTCGRGHKGQKARSGGKIHPTFEGGQTELYKLFPKRGFNNKRHAKPMAPLNMHKIIDLIQMGRLDANQPITMRELLQAGLCKANSLQHGVKLLAEGSERITQPLDLYVSRASGAVIQAVEDKGGTVTTVHYNRLALRQLLKPHKFVIPVKEARPPPKYQPYYTSFHNRGYLNPRVQMRNWLKNKPELKQKFEQL